MQLLSAVSNNQPLLKPVVAANSKSKASWKHACSVSFHNPHACLRAHDSVYRRYGLITFTKEIEAARQNCSPSPLLAQLDYVDTLVEILMQTLQHKQADRPEMHTIHRRLVSLKRRSSRLSPLMTAQNRSNEPTFENPLVLPAPAEGTIIGRDQTAFHDQIEALPWPNAIDITLFDCF